MYSEKNRNMIFKGRLEFFQKFIRFGGAIGPLPSRSTDGCRVDPWYPRKEEIGASLAIFRPILTDGNHEKNSHSYGLKMVGIA